MRIEDILFRGKTKVEGEWIYGNLLQTDNGTFVIQNYVPFEGIGKYEVDPKTVCQYTGLTDKNGRKIFEGDILKLSAWITNHGEYAVCEYVDSKNEVVEIIGFALFDVNKKLINSDEWGEFEVNGNIFDNPELMEE